MGRYLRQIRVFPYLVYLFSHADNMLKWANKYPVGGRLSMNAEQLAAVEEKWLTRQRGLVGDRETLYERDGVYGAWRDVFGQYVALARKDDLEALKRALFFIWAECSM